MKKVKINHVFLVFCLFAICIVIIGSMRKANISPTPKLNTAHLDHLFEEIVIKNEQVGIIHIYCEFPNYNWVGDSDEGIACVDDASRAAIFYLRNYSQTKSQASLNKAQLLLKFLLNMQSDNGYFYNFIWPDHSIHTGGVTTKAEPNWWSWRVLWTYGEALNILDDDQELIIRLKESRTRLVNAMLTDMIKLDRIQDTVDGFPVPTWLPSKYAADQAALILIGLTSFNSESQDPIIEQYIQDLAKGMLMMQVRDSTTFANGAFLSWQTLWHAYGNSQAYALILAGRSLNDQGMIDAALYEINNYYPALIQKGGLHHYSIKKVDEKIEVYDEVKFPQIAYNYRPMIWACIEAWKLTNDDRYLNQAFEIGNWFTGENPASQMMYDDESGRCFDGIISTTETNRNSGAESTIEALLAIQELYQSTIEK